MRILAITNLYPPLHAGTFDSHCETVAESLRLRGHSVFILTSSHGLNTEQRDEDVHRCLLLNGVYGHPAVKSYLELKSLELHNNQVLRETIEHFKPELVHVFSLHGISKSLFFTLRNLKLPVVFDVFDHWLCDGVREDPWLRFWNSPSLPLLSHSARKALEVSGERGRLDSTAPTRLMKGYERIPSLFGHLKKGEAVELNSIPCFRFDRIYFCSEALKAWTERAGFSVGHAAVIYPGITAAYIGDIKPPGVPVSKFLLVARFLNEQSGALTALKALQIACKAGLKITLSIYGRGESGYMAQLRSFAVSRQLPVDFLNVSNRNSDLPAVYKNHDVLLHTPEWAEPFPFVPLEAMGCGLPVIAADRGANELLRHGENCLTYPPGDAGQLATRVQELLISPALRCQMAEDAQSEVLAKFNDATIMDQVENFLAGAPAKTE